MQLPNDFATFSAFVVKLPQIKIAKAIIIIALVYIAYVCAQLTWQLTTDVAPVSIGQVKSSGASSLQAGKSVNIERLVDLNLFGEANKEPVVVEQVVEDAPETQLKLTLSGVVASSLPSAAAAIIEHNGQQETYGIGDKITGTRATLEQVHADRVIIKQSGRAETLMLDGFDYRESNTVKRKSRTTQTKSQRRTSQKQVVDKRTNQAFSNQVKRFKQDVVKDPGKISDYLNISPARKNGKILGYRLSPGKKPTFFKSSGLKSGDIAVQMNGLDLTDASQAQQALRLLRTEQDLSLLIDRNGELTEILFGIEN